MAYSLTIVFKSETYFYHTNYIHLKEMSIDDPSKCVNVNEYNYNELYLCLTLNIIFQKCHNCTLFEIIFTFELFLLTTSHSPSVQELTIERWHHDYSSKTRRTANRRGKMVFPLYTLKSSPYSLMIPLKANLCKRILDLRWFTSKPIFIDLVFITFELVISIVTFNIHLIFFFHTLMKCVFYDEMIAKVFPFDCLFAFFILYIKGKRWKCKKNKQKNRGKKRIMCFQLYCGTSGGWDFFIRWHLLLKCYNFFITLWAFLWNYLNVQYLSFDIS